MTDAEPKSHGLLFRPEMIRAIVEGRKTRTMRPIVKRNTLPDGSSRIRPGDTIWTRETCWLGGPYPDKQIAFYVSDGAMCIGSTIGPKVRRFVNSTARDRNERLTDEHMRGLGWRKVPGIHQPRWAARFVLKVTRVKRQAPHALDYGEILDEGVPDIGDVPGLWQQLWLSIHGIGDDPDHPSEPKGWRTPHWVYEWAPTP